MRVSLSTGFRRGVCVSVLLALFGCWTEAPYVVPETPMPPNTILLSQMMRELSATPGFTDALLAQLDRGGKKGPALMTPKLVKRLRELILGNDWQGLNRFPGWTMQEVNPAVDVINKVVAKNPGAPVGTPSGAPTEAPPSPDKGVIAEYLDLGSYAPDKQETVSLDKPSTLPGLSNAELVTELGAGVVRGDVANPQLAPMHPDSQRLADVLNRLGLNALEGAAKVTAEVDGKTATTPQELIQVLMATGHSVVIADGRYFANFGHFHYKGQDVMMPFFVDSQIAIPGTKRSLLVPVSHAEYEWTVRGPKVNADVSFYFGIDGKAEFRTMDTLDQAWVLGRHAHEYRDADAVEVTRLVGMMLIAYEHQHIKRPDLPFGGYYPLGVCQDGVAAIERKMTGHDTLFPNTTEAALWDDPRDAEINAMMIAIPKDRNGAPPAPARIFGSLPVTDFKLITIPGMTADLDAVYAAWQDGSLERTRSWMEKMKLRLVGAAVLLVLAGIVVWSRRRAVKSLP
ncbi:MAG TPA: hypothetical protein VK684_06085 [Edaphobacter sp.]|jgi:hypothetical protein|nr:hypothetical protein [Edaphobacter sp.]